MTAINGSAAAAREAARRKNGEFGEQLHTDPGDVLGGVNRTMYLAPADEIVPRPGKNGMWTLVDTVQETTVAPDRVRTVLHTAGRPDWRTRNRAASAIYADLADHDTVLAKLDMLGGKPVTLMVGGGNGSVMAVEGTVVGRRGDTHVLRQKGSRNRHFEVVRSKVLDVEPGFGGQQVLADTFARRRAQFVPQVDPIDSFDDLPDFGEGPGPDNPPIAAVYMLDHDLDGGHGHPGCVFLATDVQREDGIVNGYLWVPGDTDMVSEHGSFYAKDLRRKGGRVTGYTPGSLSMADCYRLPADRVETYRALLGAR